MVPADCWAAPLPPWLGALCLKKSLWWALARPGPSGRGGWGRPWHEGRRWRGAARSPPTPRAPPAVGMRGLRDGKRCGKGKSRLGAECLLPKQPPAASNPYDRRYEWSVGWKIAKKRGRGIADRAECLSAKQYRLMRNTLKWLFCIKKMTVLGHPSLLCDRKHISWPPRVERQ